MEKLGLTPLRAILVVTLLLGLGIWYSWTDRRAPEQEPPAQAEAAVEHPPDLPEVQLVSAAVQVPAATPVVQEPPAVEEDNTALSPPAGLATRVERVLTSLPEQDRPRDLAWQCNSAGDDCQLKGSIADNRALAMFARQLEHSAPEGDEAIPTIDIQQVDAAPEGHKNFQLAVVVP